MSGSGEPSESQSASDMPRCVPAFEARVTIGELLRIGRSKHGLRQLIPITGGEVHGPLLEGDVVPGGADWQLVRADNVVELDARYTIRARDGALIHVRNRGIWHALGGQSYVRTVPVFEAPLEGPHAALNQAIFVGTVALGEPGSVRVRVFKLV
jgi:hypothetical protein